jgi:hypothetical protein
LKGDFAGSWSLIFSEVEAVHPFPWQQQWQQLRGQQWLQPMMNAATTKIDGNRNERAAIRVSLSG